MAAIASCDPPPLEIFVDLRHCWQQRLRTRTANRASMNLSTIYLYCTHVTAWNSEIPDGGPPVTVNVYSERADTFLRSL